MRYLPLFHKLRDARCVVIGGGTVASRKVKWLLRCDAQVCIVAPELGAELQALSESLEHQSRPYQTGDLEEAMLAIAATPDKGVNEAVAREAGRLNIPVNVVDDAQLSTAIFPGIVDRDPVIVAVSTSGTSPSLASHLRLQLENFLPKSLGTLADFLSGVRQRFKDSGTRASTEFWQRLIDAGDRAPEVLAELDTEDIEPAAVGRVSIVGAGPGDPELLTLKALNRLRSADLVLYDNLVNAEILELTRRDAERRYVGKKRAVEGSRQEDINEAIVEAAVAGKNVVRLKGGDPFIFGRGGEEIATVVSRGISCDVIPGITAAIGAASYAGIPLTYRNLSQSVRFVTGHRARGSIDLDWADLARPGQTLVFYMGLFNLAEIAALLISHELPEDTPAALVENATMPTQRVVEAPLSGIAPQAEAAGISGPTVLIVGEVVRFRTPI